MNKKLTLIFATSLFLMLASCSGSNPTDPSTPPSGDIPVTSISLDKTSLTLKEEETYKLTATINPSDATDKTITWSSSKTSFVSVSNEGLVTALSEGSSTITATSSNGKTASCVVTVNKKVDPTPTDIDGVYELITSTPTIGSYVMFVYDGEKDYAMKTNTETNYRPGVEITISSNKIERNDNIAVFKVCEGNSTGTYAFYDVTNKGYLCATNNSQRNYMQLESSITGYSSFTISTGADKDIEAKSGSRNIIRFNYSEVRFSCYSSASSTMKQVSLFEKAADPIYPTEISLSGASDMNINETQTLGVGYLPSETNVKSVTFVSSSPSVASVTNSGLVTALSEGSTTITATARGENGAAIIATKDIAVHKVPATGVTLSESSKEISTRGSLTLTATVSPSNASNKNITWSTSNPNVATINNGVVTPVNPGTTVITVTTVDGSYTATCNVTVYEATKDAWTILIYMCGANLESDYANQTQIRDDYGNVYSHDGVGLAVGDIKEILSVSGKPDDVNIVIETGGANTWTNNSYGNYSNGYSIDASKLQIHHVENNKIVLDKSLTYVSMGLSTTLQSFVEYGFENYDAEKTALILWNHGGAMQGVCFDEKKNNDGLTTSEVATAVKGAIKNKNASKLEWIGYDACLMGVQDIAGINSEYANYMVAAQESEQGEGWDYDNWVDDLYAKKPTETILSAICDSFVQSIDTMIDGWEASDGYRSANDQTLAWYDLSKMNSYKTAWENMSASLKNNIGSYGKSEFSEFLKNNVKSYAGTTYTQGELQAIATENNVSVSYVIEYYGLVQQGNVYVEVNADTYGTFDVLDFLNKIKNDSTLGNGLSNLIDICISAHSELVGHKKIGAEAGNSNGICLFFPVSSKAGKSSYYTSSMTIFTNWRSIVTTYGY